MTTELIGFVAGIFLMFSFLPQLATTWRTKHAADVSMGMLAITLASAVLYEIYAWRLGLRPVLIMNGIFAAMVTAEIALKIVYDRRAKAAGASPA